MRKKRLQSNYDLYRENRKKVYFKEFLLRKIKFLLLLEKEFRLPNICIFIILFGGGLILYLFDPRCSENFTSAMITAFAAAFVEYMYPPPYSLPVQIYFYVSPLLGLFSVANGISIFISMLMGQKNKLQSWWIMTAKTYQNHVVVCGVGKVGYRIICELLEIGETVVGIEVNGNHHFVQKLLDRKVPIIVGSSRLVSVLENANIRSAKTVICATNDDLTNLDSAFTAREIKRDIRVVLRIFEDSLAEKISHQFNGFYTISTASTYAPIFVAKALDLDVSQTTFSIYDQPARIMSISVPKSLVGKKVADMEKNLEVKVLGYGSCGVNAILPSPEGILNEGDQVIVVSLQQCSVR